MIVIMIMIMIIIMNLPEGREGTSGLGVLRRVAKWASIHAPLSLSLSPPSVPLNA